jgi:DnaD/phage-associated family protein
VTGVFSGFPSRAQATAIPHVFFSDVLPAYHGDADGLGVALYALHLIARKKGFPRFIEAADLRAHAPAAAFLAASPEDAIERGLRRACDAGILRPLTVGRDGARRELYFLNTPADRRALESVRSGAVDLGGPVAPQEPAAPRPNIYALYESFIGSIAPLVADELAEAERLYPAEWIEAAFREAAAQNARSWRYVSRILERWAVEGPGHATAERDTAAGGRYFAGKYGKLLRQRLKR